MFYSPKLLLLSPIIVWESVLIDDNNINIWLCGSEWIGSNELVLLANNFGLVILRKTFYLVETNLLTYF